MIRDLSNNNYAGISDTTTFNFTTAVANTPPVFSNVGPSVAVTKQTAAKLDIDASISDAELNALNSGNGNYAGAFLTIARNGGANVQDSFSFDTVDATFTVSGANLLSGGNIFAGPPIEGTG